MVNNVDFSAACKICLYKNHYVNFAVPFIAGIICLS